MLYKENFKIKLVSESNYKREQIYDQTRCSRMKLKKKNDLHLKLCIGRSLLLQALGMPP